MKVPLDRVCMQAEMAGMERQLVSLGEQQARCTAWAKLLSHVTVMQVSRIH